MILRLSCLLPATLLILTLTASAQYCGGTLEYVVRDQNGVIIDALDVRVISLSAYHPQIDFNNSFPIHTLIRGNTSQNTLSRSQKEAIKSRGHSRHSLAGRPMSDMTEENKARHKPGNIEDVDVSTFAIRMGCGLPFAELVLEYQRDVMHLRFHNVRELDGFIDSLSFQNGTFDVDLELAYRDYPQDKSRLNMVGLRSGNNLLLPWHAKNGNLVAATNWKKAVTK